MKNNRLIVLQALFVAVLVSGVWNNVASAATPNLFANPSGETISGNAPQSWLTDDWGSTRAIFSFPSVGAQDGNRFLQTQVTRQGNGDAKWYPKHVPVTAGETYTFSDWYRSDVESFVEIEYKINNGKRGYIELGSVSPAAQWSQYSKTFVVPARAKEVTVFHYIRKVGTLNVDAYALTLGSSTGGNGGTGTPTTTPVGILNVVNSDSVAPQQIGVNILNQPLGGFVVTAPTEVVRVPFMNFYVATSAPSGLLTNVILYNENGVVVAGPVDATFDPATGKQKIMFTDTVNFLPGTHTYIVKGKLPTSFGSGNTVTLRTQPLGDWGAATGVSSGDVVALSTSTVVMNTMTAKAASLAILMFPNPPAQTTAPGASEFTFGTVQLDATQSGEDLRIASLPLTAIGNTGDLTGCQLWDGSTALNTGSNVKNSLSTSTANVFTFNNSLIISKGTVKTLQIKCNISGAAVGGSFYQFGVNSSYSYTPTGVVSGNTVIPTVITGNSQIMTIGAPSVSVSVAPSTPAYKVAGAGQTGVTLGAVNFRADNESMTLRRLGLSFTSGTRDAVSQVYIYDGATQVGTVTFVGLVATSSLMNVVLPANTDKVLTVKADIASITSGNASMVEGVKVQLDPVSAEVNSPSAGIIQTGASGTTAGVRIFKSFPTLSLGALSNSGLSDGRLLRFAATANSTGSLGIQKFTFSVSTTSVKVTNLRLFAFTDSGYSSSVSGQGANGQIGQSVAGVASSGDITFVTPTTAQQIAAGSTVYYELRGDIVGLNGSSFITTTLKGDSSFDGMKQAANVNGNLVWSPNATSTSSFLTSDWTNGFVLPGLPISGLMQVRAQ